MARYELVTASSRGKRTVMYAANSSAACRRFAENGVKDWMKSLGIKEMRLFILFDGKPIEEIEL
ncbi:MAG: hypothetical protein IKO16_05720 [Lachnospiraceae bacterium]|nr:hypothetical protein [Lachnospiraceae bacterium]